MKTVLAPAFKARMLGLAGWYSTNILGNRDGEVLDDPESFKTKEESKLGVLERSEEHTSELQSHSDLVCRLLLEKKKKKKNNKQTKKKQQPTRKNRTKRQTRAHSQRQISIPGIQSQVCEKYTTTRSTTEPKKVLK